MEIIDLKKNYMKSKNYLINLTAYYTTEERMGINHREKIRIKTNEQKLNDMWNKTEPSNTHVIKIPKREIKWGRKVIFQPTDPGRSENSKQDKCENKQN